MKIPADRDARMNFYLDLVAKCNSSRDGRKKLYELWRSFFLFGDGPTATDNIINKIYPHLEQLNALMYSSETTRFSIDLSPSASDLHKTQLHALMQSLNDDWHLSNTDMVFGMALLWAHVYGCTFIKLRVNRGRIEPYVVEPHDIGVLREDIHGLWSQEAFVQSYYITKSQLEYDLSLIPHPRMAAILENVIGTPKPAPSDSAAGVDRIVTSASSPNVVGNVNFDLTSPMRYKPQVSEDVIQMFELYVFDDEIADFRVVTIANPGIWIFDRPIEDLFIKDESPFIQICPNPSFDYFWGYSEVDKLIPLQRMRNERIEQIRHMLNLQARPPKFGSGFQGDISEIADTLDSPSGVIAADMPGAKLDNLAPNIPEDLYKEVREIDAQFEEMSGITNVIQGKGEQGVRSQGHAANLARLGSSRAKKRALVIEDQLEKLATLFMQLKQAYDKSKLRDDKGVVFVADQFTDKYTVKVDAHSNSPIFQEDQRALGFDLLKLKVIDRRTLIDFLDLPMKELLKLRLEAMEAKEAEQQQQQNAAIAAGQAKAHPGGKVTPIRG
jgi:hypothetical protein